MKEDSTEIKNYKSTDDVEEDVPGPDYVPEKEAREDQGPRNFVYTRKISLNNYDPKRKFETEDFSVTHDSFEEARALVEEAVKARIVELRGIKSFKTKE